MGAKELAEFIEDCLQEPVEAGGCGTERGGVYVHRLEKDIGDCIIDGHADIVVLAEKILAKLGKS